MLISISDYAVLLRTEQLTILELDKIYINNSSYDHFVYMEITVECSNTRDSGGIFNYHFTAGTNSEKIVKIG